MLVSSHFGDQSHPDFVRRTGISQEVPCTRFNFFVVMLWEFVGEMVNCTTEMRRDLSNLTELFWIESCEESRGGSVVFERFEASTES